MITHVNIFFRWKWKVLKRSMLYLMAHQIALLANITTAVVEKNSWNMRMTYSSKVAQALEDFSEIAIYFRLLQDLL